MTLFVLDTDHVTLFQRTHPRVVQRIRATPPESLAVTMVTVEEQTRGWLNAIRRATSGPTLTIAYARLRAALEYFQTVQILDFDDTAYERYSRLRGRKIRIGTQDLRIASVVLAVGGVLVTANTRDFSKVPGLALEDWTSR